MASTAAPTSADLMQTLPSDAARQIQWRFADRYDLQMLVQSARAVARGPVARLVAAGGRNSHEWTPAKASCSTPSTGPASRPSSWSPSRADSSPARRIWRWRWWRSNWRGSMAGAATGKPGRLLALAPIHERGTPEQRAHYMQFAAPPQPGEDRKPWRGAFCLTEPIPYVGVDTGMLNGKLSVAEWKDGEEPMLQVEKRGRFITNIGVRQFRDGRGGLRRPAHQGQLHGDPGRRRPGTFDRGTPDAKLVHQLSSTGDPIFSLRVPASRIVGGYTVKDGVIVPKLQPQRSDRSGVPAHARDGGPDDRGEAAVGRRADHPLSARAIPRS